MGHMFESKGFLLNNLSVQVVSQSKTPASSSGQLKLKLKASCERLEGCKWYNLRGEHVS
jgi:hypothetical protein